MTGKVKQYRSMTALWLVDVIKKPTVCITITTLISTLVLFIINAELFRAQLYAAQWYDLTY